MATQRSKYRVWSPFQQRDFTTESVEEFRNFLRSMEEFSTVSDDKIQGIIDRADGGEETTLVLNEEKAAIEELPMRPPPLVRNKAYTQPRQQQQQQQQQQPVAMDLTQDPDDCYSWTPPFVEPPVIKKDKVLFRSCKKTLAFGTKTI